MRYDIVLQDGLTEEQKGQLDASVETLFKKNNDGHRIDSDGTAIYDGRPVAGLSNIIKIDLNTFFPRNASRDAIPTLAGVKELVVVTDAQPQRDTRYEPQIAESRRVNSHGEPLNRPT